MTVSSKEAQTGPSSGGQDQDEFEYTYDAFEENQKLRKQQQQWFSFFNMFNIGKQKDSREEGGFECTFSGTAKDGIGHKKENDLQRPSDSSNKGPQSKNDFDAGSVKCLDLENDDDDGSIITLSTAKKFILKSMASSLFPKVEPLHWSTFFGLSFWCAIPVVGYILLFTQMGFGESFYFFLSNQFGKYATVLGGGLGLIVFFFYILDIDEWGTSIGKIFRSFWLALIFIGFVLLVMLVSNDHPYAVIAIFALFDPLWLLIVQRICYNQTDTRTFVSWLSGPLFFVSVLTAISFVSWVCIDEANEWNTTTKIKAAEDTGCVPNYESYPNCMSQDGSEDTCFYLDVTGGSSELVFPDSCDPMCTNVYNNCSNGFILWAGPIFICLSMVFLSFFCTFLRTEGTDENDILNFGKIWIFVLCILWASASLAGTAAGVTSALVTLTLSSFVASAIFISASFSKNEQKYNKDAVLARVREKYGSHLDVARGLFVVTCGPIILAYFFLSAINQLVRKCKVNPCAQPASVVNDTITSSDFVTVRTRKHIQRMKSWDRAKVFTFAIYWGVAFMIMQVIVAKLTVVFLSWMIEKTANFGLYAVTGIMAAVGVVMFLLPPVPGVPVYLTLGIVLTAQGHHILGWVGCIAYSTGVGLFLKLFSSALQQKLIGENMSHFVKIRQFVGINSKIMKAMRLVLGKGGISLPKVAILIGGPDWPTSVLCGIMKLSLFQIMLGTTPIIFLITPTCLMGALIYMASLKTETGNPLFHWAGTAATITSAVTASVQFGSMITAAYYLEQAADKRAAELEKIPNDEEVQKADNKDEHFKKCFESVTQWDVVPFLWKLIISMSLICITASCYMVQFFSVLCFKEHALTDSVYENLNGNLASLFLPLGWTAVGLFFFSIALLTAFSSWGNYKATEAASSDRSSSLIPNNPKSLA